MKYMKYTLIIIIVWLIIWESVGNLIMGYYINSEEQQYVLNLKDADINWIDGNMIGLKYEFIVKNLPSITAKYYWNDVGLIWRWSPATEKIDEIFSKDLLSKMSK